MSIIVLKVVPVWLTMPGENPGHDYMSGSINT